MHFEDQIEKSISKAEANINDIDRSKTNHPLKGQELLKYIETEKNKSGSNGDVICIGAGYGSDAKEGETKCRVDLFTTELINAKKEEHFKFLGKHARVKVLKSYNQSSLQRIVDQGCISGAAHLHLQIEENEVFFDENSQEITAYLEDQFGPDYLAKSAERTGGNKSHWKHRAVWRFIELIAIEEIEKLNLTKVLKE